MGMSQPVQLHFAVSNIKDHHAVVADIRMRETGNRFDVLEEARKAACLRLEILLTAFVDKITCATMSHDMLCTKPRGAEYTHGMVMCEHQETHRLVGDATDGGECFLCQRGGSASINDDDATFPYNEAGVGVAACDKCIHTF